MPSGQRDVIIGGGLTPVAPATQYQIPMFADNIPDHLTDSILREVLVSGGNVTHIVVGAVDPATVSAGPVETFRTAGGIISSYLNHDGSLVLGEGATITGAGGRGGIALGHNASARQDGGSSSVCIGNQATDSDQASSVIIGDRAFGVGGSMIVIGTSAGGQGGSGVIIGNSANCSNSAGGFAIGQAASSIGTQGMAIGNNTIAGVALGDTGAMAIGSGAVCNGGHSMALGFNTSVLQTGTNTEALAVGPNNTIQALLTNSMVIGMASTAQHSNAIVIGDRINSDFARQLKIGFGHAGGVADLPIFGVFIGAVDQYAGYEGITYRHCNGSGVDNSVGPLQFIAPLATGNGNAGVGPNPPGIDFFTGAVPVASGNAVQAAVLNFKVLPQSAVLTNTDAPIALPNFFDGAGAGVGTLTNAPKAGNPQSWFAINLKGVVHWVPAWHL